MKIHRNKNGHVIITAEDIMTHLVSLGDDFDLEDLPAKKSSMPRTAESQAIVDHIHSGNYEPGDRLYNEVIEVHHQLAVLTCRLAASIVYEHYNEPNEDGVVP